MVGPRRLCSLSDPTWKRALHARDFDGCTGDPSPVYEHPALAALEEDPVRAAAVDDHLDAVRERALHGVIVGRVVAVVDRGITLSMYSTLGAGPSHISHLANGHPLP